MSNLLLKVLNMSIASGWLILAVIVVRFFLKSSPKWIRCILWGLVAFRLICPFSIESGLSLIPSNETIPYDIAMKANPAIESGIDAVDQIINPAVTYSFAPNPFTSANPLQIIIPVAAIVWIIGMMFMFLYALVSYIRLKLSVGASIAIRKNILASDDVKSPFILGIFRPLIYVPSSMTGETLECVITHEMTHISRRDHWWKPLGYLLLSVYWFNPLCWIAYILLCRDIEMACDEKVIRNLDKQGKASYSQALLNCNFPRKRIAVCPLAFGEIGVKERVKSVLTYKKPAFWIIITAIAVCIVVAVCFLTSPKNKDVSPEDEQIPETEMSDTRSDEPEESELTTDEAKEIQTAEPEDSTFEILQGTELSDYLASLPDDVEELAEAGVFVIPNTGNCRGMISLSKFVTECYSGQTTAFTVGQYTTEGDLILNYVAYDGKKIILTQDSRRDKWAGSGDRISTEEYKYFSIFEWESTDDGVVYEDIVAHDDPDFSREIMFAKMASSQFVPGRKKEFAWIGSFASEYSDAAISESYVALTPEDINAVVQIDLPLEDGGICSITDLSVLRKIEEILSSATEILGTGCPFDTPMYITRKDGTVGIIYPATDSCDIFCSDGKYYDYGDSDNLEFWSLLGLETHMGDVCRKE